MKIKKINSSLNNNEIIKNFKNNDYFTGIMSSLEEVLEYEKGNSKDTIIRKHNLPDETFQNSRKPHNIKNM